VLVLEFGAVIFYSLSRPYGSKRKQSAPCTY